MRIVRVSMTGFGPYRDEQTVDFGAFEEDGLFLIAGPTGAGKSTILDAICFALYGDTPRWDSAKATAQVRSDYCAPDQPTTVVLEFDVRGDRYRITRSPAQERPKARGTGTTTSPATVLLEQRVAGQWEGRATKAGEVGAAVGDLVRLKKDEFMQVVLLAQGRFQEFLLATSDSRLAVLRTLFDTGRFDEYDQELDERSKALKARAEGQRAAIDLRVQQVAQTCEVEQPERGDEGTWLDEVVAAAASAAQACAAQQDEADREVRAADDAVEVGRRQRRRAEAAALLATLEESAADVQATRERVDAAQRAERVRPLLEAAADAEVAQEHAEAVLVAARGGYDGDVDAAGRDVEQSTATIGALQAALAAEERLPQRESVVAGLQEQIATADGERANLAAQLDTVERERAELVRRAADGPLVRERLGLARSARQAGVDAGEANARLAGLGAELASRHADVSTAIADLATLTDRFLTGQAAALSERLVAGAPCPVCGAVEHPHPATWSGERVTEADLDAARDGVDRATAAKDAADGKVAAAAAEVQRLLGAMNGRTLAELAEQVSDLGALAATIEQAERDLAVTDRQLDGAEGMPGLRRRLADLDEQRAAADKELDRAAAELTADEGLVTAGRAGEPTVSARIERLRGRRSAAQGLLDADREATTLRGRLTQARDAVARKAQDEGFPDPATAREGLLPADELAQSATRVRAHDEAMAGARSVLAQPELADLPDDPVELGAALDALATAQARRDEAIAAATRAGTRHEQVTAQRSDILRLVRETAELSDRYDVIRRLAATVHGQTPNTKGMPLESFVVAAELEAVLAAANGRLRAMSGGRYELLHSERGVRRQGAIAGLELEVLDEHTGRTRSPSSLSGGESFLASLALALGLAEVVTSRAGGIELQTLFIDEGFGSLDADTLEVAMHTLDALRQGGRTIGVISHVEAMKESIPTQLRVRATDQGWSVIEQSA